MFKFILKMIGLCFLIGILLQVFDCYQINSKLSNYPQCELVYNQLGVDGLDRCIGAIIYRREIQARMFGYYDN